MTASTLQKSEKMTCAVPSESFFRIHICSPERLKEKRLNVRWQKSDLSKYGITGTTEIVYNPSYELLFEEETKPELEGFEKGQESELGAVNVMTGIYTGRSPKDKFIVMDENSKDTVWWTSDEYKKR